MERIILLTISQTLISEFISFILNIIIPITTQPNNFDSRIKIVTATAMKMTTVLSFQTYLLALSVAFCATGVLALRPGQTFCTSGYVVDANSIAAGRFDNVCDFVLFVNADSMDKTMN